MISVWKNDGNGVVQCKACGWNGHPQWNKSSSEGPDTELESIFVHLNHPHLKLESQSLIMCRVFE